MKQFLMAHAVLLTAVLLGCSSDPQPPVAQNDPSVKAPGKKTPAAQLDPVDEPEAPKPPPKKNNSGNKAPASNEPAFVKPMPGFNPVKLPNVPDAPKGFTGKNKPDDEELPVDVQQKINSDKVAELLSVLKNSPYPKARELAADELDDSDFKDQRAEIILALRGAIRDSRPIVVKAAIGTLRDLKVYESAGEIVGLLYHPDEELSGAALYALEDFGPEALPVVAPLVNAVRDPNFHAGFKLYHTIEKLGPGAAPHVLGALKQKLKSRRLEDAIDQRYVYEALGGIGAEQELLEVLNIDDPDKHALAANGASKLPKFSPEITARMVELLKSGKEDESTRSSLTEALCKVRPLTPEVISALAIAAEDKETNIRRYVALGLEKAEPKLPEAKALLEKLQQDPDEDIRKYAGSALKTFQTNPADRLGSVLDQAHQLGTFTYDDHDIFIKSGEEYLPLLQMIINDPQQTPLRRAAAVLALEKLRFKDEVREQRTTEIKELTAKLLADESQSVLIRVAAAAHDNDNPLAGPAAVAALGNAESKLLQKTAIEIVVHTKNKSGLPGLMQLAAANDKGITREAIEALGYFGKDAESAVPTLVKLIENPEGDNAFIAVSALQSIAAQPEVCLPALEKYAYDKDSQLNYRAARAVCETVAKSEMDPLPTLRKVYLMIAQVKPEDRDEFIDAIGMMGPKAAPTVGRLVELLTDKDEDVRRSAAVALGEIGPAAKAAAVPMVNMINTDNHDRRFEIARTLESLRKIKAGGPELAKVAGTILKNKDLNYDVFRTLSEFGPECAAAAPALVELLPKLNESDRRSVWRCLKNFGPGASAAAPAIEAWIPKITEEFEREEAQEALKAIKP